AASALSTLSLHDALPISAAAAPGGITDTPGGETPEHLQTATVLGFGLAGSVLAISWVQSLSPPPFSRIAILSRWCVAGLALAIRSEEHTSELQSLTNLVC